MDPLSITVSITALLKLTKDVVLWAKEVKDAPEERKDFIRETSSLSGMLSTLVEFINDCDLSDPWLQAIPNLTAKDGPLDQLTVSLQRVLEKFLPTSTMRKLGQLLTWKHVKDDINSLLSQMERAKTLVGIALELDHIKLSHAIRDQIYEVSEGIANLRVGISDVQSDTAVVRDDVSTRQKAEFLDKICSVDYLQQHRDFFGRHQHGTGKWFLDDSKFREWINSSHGTLYCPGVPGAGKTIMAALIIEHLLRDEHCAQRPVVFIYYNYKSQNEQTLLHTLEAWLRQLVGILPETPQAVEDLYKHTPTVNEVKNILWTILERVERLTIVTDALDEFHEQSRSGVLSFVKHLQALDKVRFLATSRDFQATTSYDIFRKQPSLEVKASREDLEHYVRDRARNLRAKVQPGLREEIMQAVMTAADGMFLLAQLLMDSFQARLKVKKIKDDLQNLPKGIDAYDVAYRDAMERIYGQEEERRDYAKAVLSLVLYAVRPLKIQELQHALMVEPGDTELDYDNILEAEDIASICAGLITIEEKSNIVRFVHYTTQEYLQRTQQQWLPQACREITRRCLSYLSLRVFSTEICQSEYHPTKIRQSGYLDYLAKYSVDAQANLSLAAYACRHGLMHLDVLLSEHTLREDIEDLIDVALLVIGSPLMLPTAWQLGQSPNRRWLANIFPISKMPSTSGIHWVALQGLANVLKLCLSQKFNSNQRDESGRTLLICAASRGRNETIEFLLGLEDIDVDAADNEGRTALMRAARGGHTEAVQLLLPRAATDSRDGQGRSALSYAAENGDLELMTCLLQECIDEVDSRSISGRTPLSYAARKGTRDAVEYLLQRSDVGVNSRDDNGHTPFSYAARSNRKEVVSSFLQNNQVDKNSQCLSGRTPLSYAVIRTYAEPLVLKLLLDDPAIILDLPDFEGRTPLSFAAGKGCCVPVMLLIESGKADVNARDRHGRTPLSYASEFDSKSLRGASAMCECVEALCNAPGIMVDAKDELGRSPLFYATRRFASLSRKDTIGSRLASAAERAMRYLLEVANAEPLVAKLEEEANRFDEET